MSSSVSLCMFSIFSSWLFRSHHYCCELRHWFALSFWLLLCFVLFVIPLDLWMLTFFLLKAQSSLLLLPTFSLYLCPLLDPTYEPPPN